MSPYTRTLMYHVIQIQLLVFFLVRGLEASYCTDEQIDNCRQSAAENTLNKLAGGGVCQAKRYVQFTHLCTVNNYVPSIDYCCCAHEKKILCCRYHYDWNYFRCADSEDVIDTIPDNSLPQELLLTAILVPTAVALCCVVCCVRCLCCRDDEDDSCGCSKCRPCSKKDQSEKYSMGRSSGKRYEDVQTSIKFPYNKADKTPLPDEKYDGIKGSMVTSSLRNGAVPSMPSAPPTEDPAFAQLLPEPPQEAAPKYDGVRQNSSSSTGLMLHYVPLHHGQTPPSTLIECPYRDIHQNNSSCAAGSTYQSDPSRTRATLNCCHGNPAQNQTLIGILTNPDGRPILADTVSATPSDPPPAYDDVTSGQDKTPFPCETESDTTATC